MTDTVESAPKLDLLKSMSMLEDAQRLTPGGGCRRRRPYNFVVDDVALSLIHI